MLCLAAMVLTGTLFAQEGPSYKGTLEVHEKYYQVSQKHGKNILSLATFSTGYYDNEGFLVDRIIQKGNKTHMGRVVQNRSQNPEVLEVLSYNYMGLLASRKVEIAGDIEGEKSIIEYDSNGKILSKTSVRIDPHNDHYWTLEYGQVGYVQRYLQDIRDSYARVQERRVYDFKEELSEIHNYIYDNQEQLIAIIAQDPHDSLLFKHEYTYDENSNLLLEKYYEGEDKLLKSTNYSYDEKNRLIQKLEYIWNPRYGVIPQLKKQWDYTYM